MDERPAECPRAGWFAGLFCPYPVRVKPAPAASCSQPLILPGSALRSILLIATSCYTWSDNRRRISLWLLDQVCALWLADGLEFRQKSKMFCVGWFAARPNVGFVPAEDRPRASWSKRSSRSGRGFGAFFIGQMPGAGQQLELHSIEAAAQVLGRLQRHGPVPVSPQQKCREWTHVLQAQHSNLAMSSNQVFRISRT